MRISHLILFLALIFSSTDAFCQKSARYFEEPIWTDSLSTLFIPTRYNQEFFSTNKIAFWNDYYANIVAYNFKTDTYKKLFEKDTFIESMKNNRAIGVNPRDEVKNITSKWVILLVKTKDTNNSGRIDEKDPSVLFAVSLNGSDLKQLTDETENVVSFDVYEKQEFALIKIQRDVDKDKSFKDDDRDFYFRKISLNNLTLGNPIELK